MSSQHPVTLSKSGHFLFLTFSFFFLSFTLILLPRCTNVTFLGFIHRLEAIEPISMSVINLRCLSIISQPTGAGQRPAQASSFSPDKDQICFISSVATT